MSHLIFNGEDSVFNRFTNGMNGDSTGTTTEETQRRTVDQTGEQEEQEPVTLVQVVPRVSGGGTGFTAGDLPPSSPTEEGLLERDAPPPRDSAQDELAEREQSNRELAESAIESNRICPTCGVSSGPFGLTPASLVANREAGSFSMMAPASGGGLSPLAITGIGAGVLGVVVLVAFLRKK